MNVTNDLLDEVASEVSEWLTHYIDGQATVTITPSTVEAVLADHDMDQLRASFGDSARWVASLIRDSASRHEPRPCAVCNGTGFVTALPLL